MDSTNAIKSDRDSAVELIIKDTTLALQPPNNNTITTTTSSDDLTVRDEITPLLTQAEKPRFNIFAVSHHPRRKYREVLIKVRETEESPFTRFIVWMWSGSRYSGLLCMTTSSVIYFAMEVISGVFSVQPIPLHETAFARSAIILISSYLWLRKSGQLLFGPANARSILVMRAIVGYLSLFSFIYWLFLLIICGQGLLSKMVYSGSIFTSNYSSIILSAALADASSFTHICNICIQNLPLSQAIVISFTTPVFASLAARIFFQEELRISEIGGLVCSFFGVIFIFQQTLGSDGGLPKSVNGSNKYPGGSHHIFAVLVGLCSSVTGGISYCLIKAGTRASEHPVAPVFWFGLLASSASGLFTFTFEVPMLPDISSAFSMLVTGVLAFFTEVFLARGLQLEKTAKVANIQYLEAALSQLWGISLSSFPPSFGRLVGCLLIMISFCVTLYMGPDRESE